MLKIPCTDNLFIDETHRVFRDEIELTDDYRDDKIILKIQGKKKLLHREWLYLYSRFHFPEFINIDHISFYRIPSFKNNFAWRAKFSKPYWYDKTHLIVPMCPNLAVSDDGDVVDTITGKSRHVWSEEYLIVHVFNPVCDKYKYMKVHLLVANAWVIFNQDSAHPICNHKDGNKLNPNIDNLEWVTFQENAIHAAKTGLQSGICKCKIRHIETGECFTFSTVKEAARYLHVKPDHLYQQNRPLSSLIADKYEIRLNGDERPWLYTDQYIVMNKGAPVCFMCVGWGS